MGSFKFHLALLTIIALSTACNSSKSTTGSTFYEDDEVYYTPGETFITDVSSFKSSMPSTSETNPPPVTESVPEEDYYTENSGDGSTVNNYYGDVYQDVNGGFNNGWGSRSRLTWSPLFGWSVSYGVGWGYDPFFYDPFFYDPWAFNNGWGFNYGWGFNNGFGYYNGWGNPYWGGYYGYSAWNRPFGGWGGWGNSFVDNGNSNGIIYGHRPSFSTNSVSNSSYGSGTIFTGRNNFLRPASGYPKPGVGSRKPSSGAVPRDPERSTSPSTTKPDRGNQTNRPAEVDPPSNVNQRPNRTEPERRPSVEPDRSRGNGRTSPERSNPPSRSGGGSIDRGNSGGSSSPSRSGGGSSGGSRSGGGSGGGRRR